MDIFIILGFRSVPILQSSIFVFNGYILGFLKISFVSYLDWLWPYFPFPNQFQENKGKNREEVFVYVSEYNTKTKKAGGNLSNINNICNAPLGNPREINLKSYNVYWTILKKKFDNIKVTLM